MILETLFGLSLVMNVSLDTQVPAADPAAWMQMSVRQKDAALLPLVQRATECIVRRVSADPRYQRRAAAGRNQRPDRRLDRRPASSRCAR